MSSARGKKQPARKAPLAKTKPAEVDTKLSSKELSKFRSAVKLYEQRQYKRGYKITEGILKTSPRNGDTLALDGLFLYHIGREEEAEAQLEKAKNLAPGSYLVWHFIGLYNRDRKRYDLALENFLAALKLDPTNTNIIRDLGPLYIQDRKYPESIIYRKKTLDSAPGYRMYWTALATSQYLSGQYAEAEGTLKKFIESVKSVTFAKTDTEHTEALLFQNFCIYKQGDTQRALEHINAIADLTCDPLAIMEARAKYLLELGKHKEAEREYRALVKRNPDCLEYYDPLEKALKIDPSDIQTRQLLYNHLAVKYPRSDVIQSILLEITTGNTFKSIASRYIKSKILRGVPSTFVLLKPFYNNPEKRQAIEECILAIEKEVSGEGSVKPDAIIWANYFLSQHYNTIGDLDKAFEYIEKCITSSPDIIEFVLTKARITKHAGDFKGAAKIVNSARESDLSDRYVNSKTVKYLLRADEYSEAIQIASIFTRNDSNNVGLKDIVEMETLYSLIEQAGCQYRLGHYALALKCCENIFDIFDTVYTDQFDFHTFCMRKGTARNYFDMIDFEDKVYGSPIYAKVLKLATKLYFKIDSERLEKAGILDKIENADESEKGQLEEQKSKSQEAYDKAREQELKFLEDELSTIGDECTKATKLREEQMPPKHGNANHNVNKNEKTDPDPFGYKFWDNAREKDVNNLLFERWKKLSDQCPESLETWEIGYEIYLRQGKLVLASQIVNSKIKSVEDEVPKYWVAQRAIRLKQASLAAPRPGVPVLAPALKTLVEKTLTYPGLKEATDLRKFYDEEVLGDASDPEAIYTWIQGLPEIYGDGEYVSKLESVLFKKIESGLNKEVTDCIKDLQILQDAGSKKVDEYKQVAKKQWPLATVF